MIGTELAADYPALFGHMGGVYCLRYPGNGTEYLQRHRRCAVYTRLVLPKVIIPCLNLDKNFQMTTKFMRI